MSSIIVVFFLDFDERLSGPFRGLRALADLAVVFLGGATLAKGHKLGTPKTKNSTDFGPYF